MELDCRIYIITEDVYGKEFFKRFLKKMSKYDKKRMNIRSFRGKDKILSPKLRRFLDEIFEDGYNRRVIIFIDGDGKKSECEKEIKMIIGEYKDRVIPIIFEHTIEEWITVSLGIQQRSLTPIEALNKYLKNQRGAKKGYEKRELPKFVDKIDINKLKNLETFKMFIKALDCKEV